MKKENKNFDQEKKQNQEINDGEDLVVEEIAEEKSSFKKNKKEDKNQKKLENCEKEKQEYLEGWQRARADIANLKKSHDEEKKLFTSIGKEKMLAELVPVLDNFNAAFQGEAWENVDKNWRIGVEYIHKQFLDILENNGISEFGEVGEDVDFKKHEILEEVDGGEKDKVVQVVQKGYKMGEKIIRPAKVKVGK